ncbi:hypothetical protein [Vibrio sonorensis]|uniref:hypothetical protein n=1 Tax=Vibrio sonorensis TaxID=1004316 RepID=UPI0015862452|nr:hypothetical protein [Vibrio sonorensis]
MIFCPVKTAVNQVGTDQQHIFWGHRGKSRFSYLTERRVVTDAVIGKVPENVPGRFKCVLNDVQLFGNTRFCGFYPRLVMLSDQITKARYQPIIGFPVTVENIAGETGDGFVLVLVS